MTRSIRLLLVAAAACLLLAPSAASAAPSTPKIDVRVDVNKQGTKSFVHVTTFSQRRFEYRPGGRKGIKAYADRYRPQNMVLAVGDTRIKLDHVNELFPEFLYAHGGLTKRKLRDGDKGVLTFRNKVDRYRFNVTLKG